MKNRYIILVLSFVFSISLVMCSGGNQQVQQQSGYLEICPNATNPIECLVVNNERIPAFYTEFDMRYKGGGEDQSLFGRAYIDSKSGKYFIELSTMDIMVFKGAIIDNDVKILYRTDTDSFEGIIGKRSSLKLERYTDLDFDIDTILKVLSLKVPILDTYKMGKSSYRDNKDEYVLTNKNITDIVTFYDEIPKVQHLVRALSGRDIGETKDKVVSAFSYKYFDRAYKKATFNDKPFYFSQKVSLKYYFLDDNNEKDERNIVMGLRNNIKFTSGFKNSVYTVDFPDGITIHYDE